MNNFINTENKGECFHPGIFLKKEIDARKVKHITIAKVLDITESLLSKILRGKSRITIKMAFKLEELFNISADYWYKMQCEYDLYITRKELNK